MGGTKGYRSYRGRTSKGKIALIVVLVLVIVASVAVIWLQDYVVYDADGGAHVALPWQREEAPEEETPPQEVEVTIREPERPERLAAFSAAAAPMTRAARQYLCGLAAEIAQLGFDEILLTDLGYPTVGKIDKIDYNGADRGESIRLFLEELRAALAEYGAALSVELPAETILSGRDDTAGLVLADIAPLADRVYAVTTADQIPALTEAVAAASGGTDFAAELTDYSPDVTGSCLILGA